jgi:hypothetical protein
MIELIRKILLDIIKLKCNKHGKKSIESDEHFLDMFIIFLKDHSKWKNIDKKVHTSSKYTADNYRKKFSYWTRCGVFRDTIDVVNAISRSNLIKENLNCIIDATNIRNINGSYKRNIDNDGNTLLGRLYCDKFKRCLKVTVLITDKNHLLDVNISKGNAHDVSVVPKIYKKLVHVYKSNKKRRINVIGDKGYTNQEYKHAFAKHKMHYIIPDKSNKTTIDKYTYYNTDLLNKRILVENYFAHLKQHTRLRLLYDKLVYVYEGFVMLGILCLIKNVPV